MQRTMQKPTLIRSSKKPLSSSDEMGVYERITVLPLMFA
jgi:hypothetical protein